MLFFLLMSFLKRTVFMVVNALYESFNNNVPFYVLFIQTGAFLVVVVVLFFFLFSSSIFYPHCKAKN